MIIRGNDRILFIKRGDIFQPVGCLTSNGMSEETETLPTTTRNSQGWRTSVATLQAYNIAFEGLQVPTSFRGDSDVAFSTRFEITITDNEELAAIRFRIESDPDWFILVQKVFTSEEIINPAGQVEKGADATETAANFVANLQTYNPNPIITYSSVGNKVVLTFNSSNEFVLTNFQAGAFSIIEPVPIVATAELITEVIPNPSPLISYDRLKIIKRSRELITWRIMSASPFPSYIEEGEGYIIELSENSPVNEDATFSGSIQGWGVPRIIQQFPVLSTDGEIIEDGNDNLITP
jgi:hypothetical protein